MHLTRITSAKRAGFAKASLYSRKDHPKQTMLYMKQKSSFFIAVVSMVAFLSGNMVGEHGWYAFWKSVIGKYDDSLITYTGTVMPITLVPDYAKWAQYGGNADEHTFKQVPKDVLVPLKPYNPKSPSSSYSTGYMGSYADEGDGHGSHLGVDIRVPIGTPVVSVANGIVTSVKNDPGGFGLYVVIRHPHMPDPDRPEYETVLHSVYSHLSSQLVSEGDIVQKGQQIGLSGMTGFATGPHLHFQMDRDTAPWHPYWPFTGAELRDAGLSTTQAVNKGFHQERGYEYTVQPMLVVQANLPAAKYKDEAGGKTAVVKKPSTTVTTKNTKSVAQLAQERRNQRLASRPTSAAIAIAIPTQPAVVATIDNLNPAAPAQPVVVPEPAPTPVPAPVASGNVTSQPFATIDIQTPSTFAGRTWLTVRFTLLDADGNTTTNIPSDKLYLRTSFGEAEFATPVLTAKDFKDGVATVQMLPRGTKTVIVSVEPMKINGDPIKYAGE